jgi:CheY-like chemotaxis protein
MHKIETVLLVDDAPVMRRVGEKFLTGLGLNVVKAADGYEALSVIRREKPDACFIDVDMPNLTGLQLVSILRANSDYRTCPIAMLTSASTAFDRQKGLLVGADLYLTKPFSPDTIAAAVAAMQELFEGNHD